MRRLAVLALVLALPGVAAAANGRQVYGRYCAMCHGPNGAGQTDPHALVGGGPGRDQTIEPGLAPSLRNVGALAADFYLRTGYMPLKRTGIQPRRSRLLLSSAQIDALIHYVASLGHGPPVPTVHPERGNLSKGQALFAENCAGCHQIVARGGYVTHAVPPPLGDATATQVAEAVRLGPYVMPRFTAKQISNAQLDSLVRYVLWTHHPDDRGGWSLGRIGPVPEGLVTWFIAAAALLAVCLVIGRRLQS
ncbi:MAG TPA: c-type cytochrome [Gaiellaceae bacterium]|nr:c-type cytochrome [Gaiellaceae bacterium]